MLQVHRDESDRPSTPDPPARGSAGPRSEERRVGKECRSRWPRYHQKKNDLNHGVIYPDIHCRDELKPVSTYDLHLPVRNFLNIFCVQIVAEMTTHCFCSDLSENTSVGQ